MTALRPMQGVRVVELGVVIAGPAATAMLADWGASVIKIEPPTGDPHRGNSTPSYFELDNRDKRSICLDLKTRGGRDVAMRLLETADVFVTNLRPAALLALELEADRLRARFPRLIYVAVTGYGADPEVADKAGYDIGAYWARTGMAYALTTAGEAPPVSRPGLGDHPTALAAAAGIAAALFDRERTGEGALVETSLVRAGAYTIGADLMAEIAGSRPKAGLRRALYNPLLGCYRAADDRWFWLLGLQASRHWPALTRAIDAPELMTDPRFDTYEGLIKNRDEVMEILDAAFATRPLVEWSAIFTREEVWWDPVQSFAESIADPLLAAAGVFRASSGTTSRTVASPIDFNGTIEGAAGRAPEAGENTEELLLEFGYSWEDIAALRTESAIP